MDMRVKPRRLREHKFANPLIAMAICNVCNFSGGAKVAGFVSAVVLLSYGEHPWVHAWYRLSETILGIGVAWLISLVPRLIQLDEKSDKPPTT
jgi:hypothetical protein